MPFTKGKSGNPNGRPKGVENKASRELKEQVRLMLTENFEQFVDDFKSLSPKDRFFAYKGLLSYLLPKPNDKQEVSISKDAMALGVDLNEIAQRVLSSMESDTDTDD